MITNLVAVVAVSLVTNVSERFEPSYWRTEGGLTWYDPNHYSSDTKYKLTQIIQRTVTSVNVSSNLTLSSTNDAVLSQVEVKMHKVESWVGTSTNVVDTNLTLISGTWEHAISTNDCLTYGDGFKLRSSIGTNMMLNSSMGDIVITNFRQPHPTK